MCHFCRILQCFTFVSQNLPPAVQPFSILRPPRPIRLHCQCPGHARLNLFPLFDSNASHQSPFSTILLSNEKDKHKFYSLKCFLSISRYSINHYISNQIQRKIKERSFPFFQPHLSTLSPSCVCLTELVGQIKTCKDYFCFVFLLFYLFIHLFLTYYDF